MTRKFLAMVVNTEARSVADITVFVDTVGFFELVADGDGNMVYVEAPPPAYAIRSGLAYIDVWVDDLTDLHAKLESLKTQRIRKRMLADEALKAFDDLVRENTIATEAADTHQQKAIESDMARARIAKAKYEEFPIEPAASGHGPS